MKLLTHLALTDKLSQREKAEGNKVRVQFTSVGDGLMVGKKNLLEPTIEINEPLKRFQICGSDKIWHWAEAKIISKDAIEVWHENISNPRDVRYAWSSNPTGANLYNKAGLPTSLFKTDNL